MNEENEKFSDWLNFGIEHGWISEVYDATKEEMPLSPMEELAIENEVHQLHIPFVRVYGPRYNKDAMQ